MEPTEPTSALQAPPTDAAASQKPKKPRLPKPSFEEFLEQWRACLGQGKGSVGKLRSLLMNGFTGDVKQEYVLQLSAALMPHPEFAERLGVLLATQNRVGRLTFLPRSVLDQIRIQTGERIDYHADDFSGANGAYAVERFVEANAPKRRTLPQPPEGGLDQQASGPASISADSWLRIFYANVCAEPEPKVFLNGMIAAGKWWLGLNSAVFSRGRGDVNLAKAFAAAISGGAISRQKLELVFTGIGPLQQQFTALLNRELELTRRVQHRDEALEELGREKEKLQDRLATSETERALAQQRAEELQQQLAEAEEKYRLLDEHWRAVSQQNLNKQSGSFRERIGHELQEALLSLERESPNVGMALLRLKRIQEVLKQAGPKEE